MIDLIRILFIGTLLMIASCHSENMENHDHTHADDTRESEAHDHDHGEISLKHIAYSDHFELYAEADAFVKGQKANILAHISQLKDFLPMDNGSVEFVLEVGTTQKREIKQEAERKGIYTFTIEPEFSGKASAYYIIHTGGITDTLVIDGIRVYKTADDAFHEENKEEKHINTTSFTKEQSWKVDFRTENPKLSPFGKVIRTVGQVQGTQNDEIIISARTNGIVRFVHNNLIEGKGIMAGQSLLTISSKGFVDNNLSARLSEAKNNLSRAQQDFDRNKDLFDEKIITEKEFLESKNDYENALLSFENLNKNYNPGGQMIKSPATAYVHEMFVQNGQYVEAGQKIMSLIKNKKMVIQADVDLKNARILPNIRSVTVNNVYNDEIIEFEDLNREVLTIGQHTNSDNFMVPVTLQLSGKGNFVPGSFVELYLKTALDQEVITVPNSALMEEQGKMFVYAQIHPELFEKRYVVTGVTDGIRTEIKKGIGPEERLVTEGAIFVKLSQMSEPLDAHAGHVH